MITPQSHQQDFDKYLAAQSFLAARSVPVPAVLDADSDSLRIVLEDLGGADYFSRHPSLSEQARREYYERFTDTIITIESLTDDFNSAYQGTKELLGFERLSWELDFFLENYLALYPEKRQAENDLKSLKEFLMETAREAASFPVRLCHRDYHSKNIMMTTDGGFRIIDFQDLRLGPYNYDLASLLWDSYVTPSDEIISAMENRFFSALSGLGIEISFDEFRRQNRITALQRNIKAIGTFANQARKGKSGYIQFITPTVSKIIEHIQSLKIENGTSRIIKTIF